MGIKAGESVSAGITGVGAVVGTVIVNSVGTGVISTGVRLLTREYGPWLAKGVNDVIGARFSGPIRTCAVSTGAGVISSA